MEFFKLNHNITFDDLNQFKYTNQKIGVIAHIENEQGEILLQQRGIKSRDENGLFEDIGGKFEDFDKDFKAAILREISEEAGDNINFNIDNYNAICHIQKNNINWIFIIFFVKYIDGVLEIKEPEKCMGYKFFKYEEVINSSLVTNSCKYISKNIEKLK